MFPAHLDQHLAHVTDILLLPSSGGRADAEVPSNMDSVLDSTTQRRNSTRKLPKTELVHKECGRRGDKCPLDVTGTCS